MTKNILITPKIGNNPRVDYFGDASGTIHLEILDNGSLSWIGNHGTLFSIVDDVSGSLMSVNNISGLPIFEVFSYNQVDINGEVKLKLNLDASGTLYVKGKEVYHPGNLPPAGAAPNINWSNDNVGSNNEVLTATGDGSIVTESNLKFTGSSLDIIGRISATSDISTNTTMYVQGGEVYHPGNLPPAGAAPNINWASNNVGSNNQMLTATGDGSILAESNMTFNGSELRIIGDVSVFADIRSQGIYSDTVNANDITSDTLTSNNVTTSTLHSTSDASINGALYVNNFLRWPNNRTFITKTTTNGGTQFGADESTILSSGEGGTTTSGNVNLNTENIYLSSDFDILFYSNLQTGWGARETMSFGNDGLLSISGGIDASENIASNNDINAGGSMYVQGGEVYHPGNLPPAGAAPNINWANDNVGSNNQMLTATGDGSILAESTLTYDGTKLQTTSPYIEILTSTANPRLTIRSTNSAYRYPELALINTDNTWLFSNRPSGVFAFTDGGTNNRVFSIFPNSNQDMIKLSGSSILLNAGETGSKIGVITQSPIHELDVSGNIYSRNNLLALGDLSIGGSIIGDNVTSGTDPGHIHTVSSISGTLPVSKGGTGKTSLVNNRVLTGGTTIIDEPNLTFDGIQLYINGKVLSSNIIESLGDVSVSGTVRVQGGEVYHPGNLPPAGAAPNINWSSNNVGSNNQMLTATGDGSILAETSITYDGTTLQLGDNTKSFVLRLAGNNTNTESSKIIFDNSNLGDGMIIQFSSHNDATLGPDGLIFYNDNAGTPNVKFNRDDGFVGMGGQMNPSVELDVTGEIEATSNITAGGTMYIQGQEVYWPGNPPPGGGGTGSGDVAWASGNVGSNNQLITAVGDGSIISESNLTFNGSTLSVSGTVAATTVTGANVTSGSDPGHTHALTGAYLTGILPVSKGGTGVNSLGNDRILTGGTTITAETDLTFDGVDLNFNGENVLLNNGYLRESKIWYDMYDSLAKYRNVVPFWNDLAFWAVEKGWDVSVNRSPDNGDLARMFKTGSSSSYWDNISIGNPMIIEIIFTGDILFDRIDIAHGSRNSMMIDYVIDIYEDANNDTTYQWTNIATVTGNENKNYLLSHSSNVSSGTWRTAKIRITCTAAGNPAHYPDRANIRNIQIISSNANENGGLATAGINTFYGSQTFKDTTVYNDTLTYTGDDYTPLTFISSRGDGISSILFRNTAFTSSTYLFSINGTGDDRFLIRPANTSSVFALRSSGLSLGSENAATAPLHVFGDAKVTGEVLVDGTVRVQGGEVYHPGNLPPAGAAPNINWANDDVGSNNEVLTATGDGSIVSESNMTFNGSTLSVTGTVNATGTMNIQGQEVYHPGNLPPSSGGGSGDINWANGNNGSNNQILTAYGDGSIVAESNISFNGSTLTVNGTVAATTVTGANVTSGSDPGHTHSTITGTLPVSKGGTGITNIPTNRLLTGNNTNPLTAEANLTFNGSTLTVNGIVAATTVNTTANVNATGTVYVQGQEVFHPGNLPPEFGGFAGDVAWASGNNGQNNQVITAVGDGSIYTEANLTFNGSLLSVTGNITASGTITGDTIIGTNVTSGNDPGHTHTTSNIISGIFSVDRGGTGKSSLGTNRLLTGNGTSAIVDEANLTFNGSTLSVTGTVAATTVTGANVTSGTDPGHTHTVSSVSGTLPVSKGGTGNTSLIDNRVLTGGSTINDEANLIFNGSLLDITGSLNVSSDASIDGVLYLTDNVRWPNGRTFIDKLTTNGATRFGGDESTILSSGEGYSIASSVPTNQENIYLAADGYIEMFTGLQSGFGGREFIKFDNTGLFTMSGGIDASENILSKSNIFAEGKLAIGTNTISSTHRFTINDPIPVEYGTVLSSAYSNSILRSILYSAGQQTWNMYSASNEVGSVNIGAPGFQPGIFFINDANNVRSQIGLGSQSGGMSFGAAATNQNITQMYLDTTGYFGINTTDPIAYLDVNGNIYGNDNLAILNDIDASGTMYIQGEEVYWPGNPPPDSGAGGSVSWAFGLQGSNSQLVTAYGDGSISAETNLTFNGSTLQVTGTVVATTIQGTNVTSGTDPGHTHTTSSVSGTWAVNRGGTGRTSLGSNRILTGNGTSAISDESNLTFDGTTLLVSGVISATGTIAGINVTSGADPGHTHALSGSSLTGTLPVSKGGTGKTSIGINRILTGNGTGALTDESNLTFGSNILTVNSDINASGTITGGTIIGGNVTSGSNPGHTHTTSTVTGTWTVNRGGTGKTSLGSNRLLTGNGTSAIVDEANLTFNGSTLTVTGTVAATTLNTTSNVNASGSVYVNGEEVFHPGNLPPIGATPNINWADDDVGFNNEVLTAYGDGSIVAESNMKFSGSALTVTGTISATSTISGINVTSGSDPGHTHTLSSVSGTVPVNRGGTGRTSVGTDRILTGNGTGALTDESNLTFTGSLLNINGELNVIGDTSVHGNLYIDNDLKWINNRTFLQQVTTGGATQLGADQSTTVSSGEAYGQMASNVSLTTENVYLASDFNIQLYTNLQNGWANRHYLTMDNAGLVTISDDLTVLGNINANGVTYGSDPGHTHALAGSSLTGILPVSKGGTGKTSVGTNRILTGNGTGALTDESNLTFGSNILTVTGAINTSGNIDGGTISGGNFTSSGTISGVNINASSTVSATTVTGGNVTSGTNPGHTHTSSSISGTIPVSKGGTGLTTVPTNRILTGNNTNALSAESNLTFGSNTLTVNSDINASGTITGGTIQGTIQGANVTSGADPGHTHSLSGSSLTGTLTVSKGGTGRNSLTNDSLLTGAGTAGIIAESNLRYNESTGLYVNNTATFVDDVSALNGIRVKGTNEYELGLGVTHSPTASKGTVKVTTGNLHLDSASGSALYLNYYSSGRTVQIGHPTNNTTNLNSYGNLYVKNTITGNEDLIIAGDLDIGSTGTTSVIKLSGSTSASIADSRIEFRTPNNQHGQLRWSDLDSERAPFGFNIERTSDNNQPANNPYLYVQGNIYAGDDAIIDKNLEVGGNTVLTGDLEINGISSSTETWVLYYDTGTGKVTYGVLPLPSAGDVGWAGGNNGSLYNMMYADGGGNIVPTSEITFSAANGLYVERDAYFAFDLEVDNDLITNYDVYMNGIPQGTQSNVLYYDAATSRVYYGATPSGGTVGDNVAWFNSDIGINNEIVTSTGDGDITSESGLTYNGTTLSITGGISASGIINTSSSINATTILQGGISLNSILSNLTANKVLVSNNDSQSDWPIVFHNNSNTLYDNQLLTYNPDYGELNVPAIIGGSASFDRFNISDITGTNTSAGLSLYSSSVFNYGLQFLNTNLSGYGTHGKVTGSKAIYFNNTNTSNYGWIFRNSTIGPVASISNFGQATFNTIKLDTYDNTTSVGNDEAIHDGMGIRGNRSNLYITNANTSGTIKLGFNSVHGSGEVITINGANGRVGIGDSTPSYDLDVAGTGRFTNRLYPNNGVTVTNNSIFNGDIDLNGDLNGDDAYQLTMGKVFETNKTKESAVTDIDLAVSDVFDAGSITPNKSFTLSNTAKYSPFRVIMTGGSLTSGAVFSGYTNHWLYGESHLNYVSGNSNILWCELRESNTIYLFWGDI